MYFNNATNIEHDSPDIIILVGESFLIVLSAAGSLSFSPVSLNHGLCIWADTVGDNQWLSSVPSGLPPHDVFGQPTECKQYTLHTASYAVLYIHIITGVTNYFR